MNKRKSQKIIQKAISNLVQYANRDPWSYRQQQLYDELFHKAADHLNISTNTLINTLEASDYIHMAHAYLFELFAAYHWDNDNYSLISAYLQNHSRKESPYGKRYLQALDNSHIELWQIVSTHTGQAVDIRPAGTDNSPIRVYEQSALKQLQGWEYIAARVITLDNRQEFSSAILPFTLDQAIATHSMLANIYRETADNLQPMQPETSRHSNNNIKSMATVAVNAELPHFLFVLWSKQVYLTLTQTCPHPA